jgi:hypothetical protein
MHEDEAEAEARVEDEDTYSEDAMPPVCERKAKGGRRPLNDSSQITTWTE